MYFWRTDKSARTHFYACTVYVTDRLSECFERFKQTKHTLILVLSLSLQYKISTRREEFPETHLHNGEIHRPSPSSNSSVALLVSFPFIFHVSLFVSYLEAKVSGSEVPKATMVIPVT